MAILYNVIHGFEHEDDYTGFARTNEQGNQQILQQKDHSGDSEESGVGGEVYMGHGKHSSITMCGELIDHGELIEV